MATEEVIRAVGLTERWKEGLVDIAEADPEGRKDVAGRRPLSNWDGGSLYCDFRAVPGCGGP